MQLHLVFASLLASASALPAANRGRSAQLESGLGNTLNNESNSEANLVDDVGTVISNIGTRSAQLEGGLTNTVDKVGNSEANLVDDVGTAVTNIGSQ